MGDVFDEFWLGHQNLLHQNFCLLKQYCDMLKVQLIKYLKHIFTVLTLILNTFSSYKKY